MINDEWSKHKDDYLVWRRFWALFELRRKWNWANWFYKQIHRENDMIVEPNVWGLFPGEGYMKLCLWIALLKSVHEGITRGLDPFDTPGVEKVDISEVLPTIPKNIQEFPAVSGTPFSDFRNAVFHCQWSPEHVKFDLDGDTTKAIDILHNAIGDWLNKEFRKVFVEFKINYPEEPMYWIYSPNGKEFMSEIFY